LISWIADVPELDVVLDPAVLIIHVAAGNTFADTSAVLDLANGEVRELRRECDLFFAPLDETRVPGCPSGMKKDEWW
jgi:hypothetical protein